MGKIWLKTKLDSAMGMEIPHSINIANVEPNKCGGTGTKAVLVNQTGITGNETDFPPDQ